MVMATPGKKQINFGAGPAKIPETVMLRAQREFTALPGTGISAVEMSHRSSEYQKLIYNETVQLLRQEMSIPDDYEVLFMHGGASGQFAAIPLNLKRQNEKADYAVTGRWSSLAAKEASKFITVNSVLLPQKRYTTIPSVSEWKRDPNAAYLYYCANETVDGVEFKQPPETLPGIPLVADVSSNFLSRPLSFRDHGIVFGSTQKNLGAAGLAIVIVRKDLINNDHNAPAVLSYYEMEKSKSNYNTPNVFAIYMTKLVLEWIREQGGVSEIYRRNQAKAKMIYDTIDNSCGFYSCAVDPEYRSCTNIPFRVGGAEGNTELEEKFIAGAVQHGMIGLKGHRSVGGVRASLYNAITIEETEYLKKYMEEFQRTESA